ncbi:MAG: YbhB/YbcL family Raf kinase inhibitor-like protein, partial [Deltaproteobacteria bacterium]|nr:YbhB/YbcL family Raf kinase inhibitor-like protein [Deltaproteobacteria bacterium]
SGFYEGKTATGARTVDSDFHKPGWGGPCPPPGHGVHHYVFTLYALKSAKLEPAPSSFAELKARAGADSLGIAVLTGTYER